MSFQLLFHFFSVTRRVTVVGVPQFSWCLCVGSCAQLSVPATMVSMFSFLCRLSVTCVCDDVFPLRER